MNGTLWELRRIKCKFGVFFSKLYHICICIIYTYTHGSYTLIPLIKYIYLVTCLGRTPATLSAGLVVTEDGWMLDG